MRRATKVWWLGLGAASSCIALACAGNNATTGPMNDAGTAGSAGTGSAGVAGSTGLAGSSGAAGSIGSAGAAQNPWDCTILDCALSVCPAERPTSGANCAPTPTLAKDPTADRCCPYASPCAAPDDWALFGSDSACMGIDSGGGCPAGFSDCNQSMRDGCETRTPVGTTCANACTAEPNATYSSSASSFACSVGPCPTGTVCVVEEGGVAGGGGARCEPIPANCDGKPSCACMKYCSCRDSFGPFPESCSEDAGVIYCDNGIR